MIQYWEGVGSTRKAERRAELLWWQGRRNAVSEAPILLIALARSPIRVVLFPDLSLKRGMTKGRVDL